ncbi:class I SAM-dependent methyltransferase [Salegentibacter sp. HM20]
MRIKNPINPKKGTVTFIENFKTKEIVDRYKRLDIQVSRFFDKENIQLYKCVQTGYRFYYPFSIIGDAKFYEDLSNSRKNYYSERWEHTKALEFIQKDNITLEVGSGFGSFLNLLDANGIKAKGLELNSVAVRKCKDQGLLVENNLIEKEAIDNKEKYDVVCYFQVLEHIAEVGKFIQASLDLLKIGGKLIIGVPNNNPYLFKNDRMHTLNLPPHHAGLWDEKSLKNLQEIFQLRLVHIEFEPLELSYSEFIEQWSNNQKNSLARKITKVVHKKFPKVLKKVCCKLINGRNIFAVFEKI